MIAKLWFNQILNGNKTFNEVPNKLKEKVAILLQKADKINLIDLY